MRLARVLAGFALFLVTGSAAAQRDAAPRLYTDSWAVIIGINDYQHRRVPKLRYAVNDARAVERALLAQGFHRDRITTLVDSQATKVAIERVLGDQLRAQMGSNDRLLVFFAGHGRTDTLRSGEEEGYLLPVDGDPSQLFSTAISMTAARHISERLPAKHILYVVDACYSGYALFNRAIADDLLEEMVKKPAIQILTAGRQQDQAQERGGHGVFTEILLRGLQGDAFAGKDWLALEELGLWVKQRVFAESNKKQLPQYGNLAGEGQFVFVRPEAPVAFATRQAEEQARRLEEERRRLEEDRRRLEEEKRLLEERRSLKEERERLEAEHKRLEDERRRLQSAALPQGTDPRPVPQGPAQAGATHKITYRVSGTASEAMLTYRNARGGTEQRNVRPPWDLSLDFQRGEFVYVSAQNVDVSGSVACEILVDGVSKKDATSSGPHVIAECRVPGDEPGKRPPPVTKGRVTYLVKGTATGAMLTYRNSAGGTEQSQVRLPWETSFEAGNVSFPYISAQNEGVSGSVICEILLDGVPKATATSSGAYVIAECLPR